MDQTLAMRSVTTGVLLVGANGADHIGQLMDPPVTNAELGIFAVPAEDVAGRTDAELNVDASLALAVGKGMSVSSATGSGTITVAQWVLFTSDPAVVRAHPVLQPEATFLTVDQVDQQLAMLADPTRPEVTALAIVLAITRLPPLDVASVPFPCSCGRDIPAGSPCWRIHQDTPDGPAHVWVAQCCLPERDQ